MRVHTLVVLLFVSSYVSVAQINSGVKPIDEDSSSIHLSRKAYLSCIDVDGNYIPGCTSENVAKCSALACKFILRSENQQRMAKEDQCNAETAAKVCYDELIITAKGKCNTSVDQCMCSGSLKEFSFTWNFTKTHGCIFICRSIMDGKCDPTDNQVIIDPRAFCGIPCSSKLNGYTILAPQVVCSIRVLDDETAKKHETELKERASQVASLNCDPSNKGSPCSCQGEWEISKPKFLSQKTLEGSTICSVSYDISLIGTCKEKKNGNADLTVVGPEP